MFWNKRPSYFSFAARFLFINCSSWLSAFSRCALSHSVPSFAGCSLALLHGGHGWASLLSVRYTAHLFPPEHNMRTTIFACSYRGCAPYDYLRWNNGSSAAQHIYNTFSEPPFTSLWMIYNWNSIAAKRQRWSNKRSYDFCNNFGQWQFGWRQDSLSLLHEPQDRCGWAYSFERPQNRIFPCSSLSKTRCPTLLSIVVILKITPRANRLKICCKFFAVDETNDRTEEGDGAPTVDYDYIFSIISSFGSCFFLQVI